MVALCRCVAVRMHPWLLRPAPPRHSGRRFSGRFLTASRWDTMDLRRRGRRQPVMEAGQEFGVLLRQARRHGGLTQEELAHRSGLSTRTISDLERGRVARPRGSSLDLLVAALPADEATVAGLVAAARAGTALALPPDGRRSEEHTSE